MNNNYYYVEYMMKAQEIEIQKNAREAWKWSTGKSDSKWHRILASFRQPEAIPCCTQSLQACC